MSAKDEAPLRAETDASLQAERRNTDEELARRIAVTDGNADELLRLARDRADRLLSATRAAADAGLSSSEQAEAVVGLLVGEREDDDRRLAAERERADALIKDDRREQREKLSAMLALERQATDLHLALERRSADNAIASRDAFLAQTSHDLRGLMAANRMYLAVLAKECKSDEHGPRLAAHVATLVKIDAHVDRLVGDLVDVVAIEAGRLAVTLRPHSAAELLSTATAVFEPLAKDRGQSLSVTPAMADVSVMVDAARGVQVLGNLLSNAIKFTPRYGKISVGYETTNDAVTFLVADTGPGIPADQAEHIFERFVGSKRHSKSLGLGLFIADRLVEAHGGRLWFESDEARGTVFRFTLKRAHP